ncbi:GNAT family N-acetyltransferase [Niabella aquatica]
MKQASHSQKDLIVDILSNAFNDNKSVNYIVPQDAHRIKRIRALMAYAYEICSMFGEVLITEDESACALLMYPDKKRTSIRSVFQDVLLVIRCLGFTNIKKAAKREALIKRLQPKGVMTYLWFIGVDTGKQNKGVGSQLLQSVISKSDQQGRVICLETSTLKNIPWYKKSGFEVYKEVNLSYKLFFLKREPQR